MMAAISKKLTKDEISQISLFWPGRQDLKDKIERKLIAAMMEADGALDYYPQLVSNLPISTIAKSELNRLYNMPNTSAFSIFQQLLGKVNVEKGADSNIGIFLDTMHAAGTSSILAVDWADIEGLVVRRRETSLQENPAGNATTTLVGSITTHLGTSTTSSTHLSTLLLSEQSVRQEVLDVLLTDADLIKGWAGFCGRLNIPDADQTQWEQQYARGTITNYALIRGILSFWGSRGAGQANVAKLCEVLKKMRLHTCAEKLQDKFKTS